MQGQTLSRRSFVGSAAALALLLAGCSQGAVERDGAAEGSGAIAGSAPVTSDAAPEADAAAGGDAAAPTASTLVAYFSATGNTEAIAQTIAAQLGADTFAIAPTEPYTDADLNYNDSSSRASIERADARPALVQVTPDAWDGYDTVLVGYPIWWGEAAWPLRTFAEGNDFAGKTVVPFCTSASSGIGRSGEQLASMAGSGDWREGARFAAGAGDDEVGSWLAGLGIA